VAFSVILALLPGVRILESLVRDPSGTVVCGTDYPYPRDAISIAAYVTFKAPLSLTTASAAAFWVARPLG